MTSDDRTTLRLTRIYDRPPSALFKAWTEPQQIKRWWGPRGYTTLSCEMDLRPGGKWHVCSRSPDGTEYAEHGVFREIVEPLRLVFTHAWEKPQGIPEHETLITVTFEEHQGRTMMTVAQGTLNTVESRDSHGEGWSSAFELLEELFQEPSGKGDEAGIRALIERLADHPP